jgi:NAD(P) transhydrogenase subunit beta
VTVWVRLVSLVGASCFVLGLHLMNSPGSARRGNRLSAAGMIIAVLAVLVSVSHGQTMTFTRWSVLLGGLAVGSGAGLIAARRVAMTSMPQLVSCFNAVGGGAAALIALGDYLHDAHVSAGIGLATVLDVFIGAVTFSGSLVAAAKLQGYWSQPVRLAGSRILSVLLLLAAGGSGAAVAVGTGDRWPLLVTAAAALAIGVIRVLPIGGADMPVVISLLNAFTGTAVAMAGFVLENATLTIAGALVGASGAILTKLMADAMNRPILAIMSGGFGTGSDPGPAGGGSTVAGVKAIAIDDAALQLVYAGKVVIVPGYGLAAAQAQHEVRELGELLEARGVEVSYAIHPVAGRMPGHMNVLLAEANVDYEQLREMDEANPEFDRTDVALVIGANDVTNPAARRPGNAVSGMPILNVDRARSVIVIKRSMASGYAGIDNDLYSDPRTSMLFADAKKGLAALIGAAKLID